MAHTMSASTGKDEATRRPDFPEELFKQEAVMEHEPIVFVGIDWASTEHQVCLLSPKGPVQRAFTHDALGLGAMVDWLAAQADDPEQVAVAIEMPHGPVVEALMDRQIAVFAINPKQLDRFRDRFSPAGAKDDRRDALVLASSLRTDRHCFRRVEPLDPKIIELREWSRMADELKEEHRRLSNRIRQQLWRYYPQAIELGDDQGSDCFLDLWALAPTGPQASCREAGRPSAGGSSHPTDDRGAGDGDPATASAHRCTRNRGRRRRPYWRRGRAGAPGESATESGEPTTRRHGRGLRSPDLQ
jgi:hypothetical protein